MESLRARCRIVTAVLVVILVLSAVSSLSDLSVVQYLQAISFGEPADDARAEAIDSRQAAIALLQAGAFLASAIVFLMWFYRAHKNLKVGGLDGLRYTARWAVGCFFVPFPNLVRPFQVMKEVWKSSTYFSGPCEKESWMALSTSFRVGWWWALFLISSVLGNASLRSMLRADGLEDLPVAGWVTFASDVVDIPAALAALFLVRHVTELQERARIRLQAVECPVAHDISMQRRVLRASAGAER